MGRRTLSVFLFLIATLATACAVPGTDAAETADCQKGLVEGMLAGPIEELDVENDELKGRIHRICEQLVAAGLDDRSSDEEFMAVLRDKPQITGELCEISTEALYADGFDSIVESSGGYVTRDEAMRMGRDGCVYAITEGYGSLGNIPNASALNKAHPYLMAPFCRALFMQAYDQKGLKGPRKVYEAVVTDACMEAIRTGVVDYSAGGPFDPSIDERRFRQLLRAEWAKR
ncbi:MAG TPA: hypothetical protein VFG61_04230 [Gaiellaceae bacterium]|jgi:hypothetical protein|nr:hypothetical protein [Gaiellaceae bacterium]